MVCEWSAAIGRDVTGCVPRSAGSAPGGGPVSVGAAMDADGSPTTVTPTSSPANSLADAAAAAACAELLERGTAAGIRMLLQHQHQAAAAAKAAAAAAAAVVSQHHSQQPRHTIDAILGLNSTGTPTSPSAVGINSLESSGESSARTPPIWTHEKCTHKL